MRNEPAKGKETLCASYGARPHERVTVHRGGLNIANPLERAAAVEALVYAAVCLTNSVDPCDIASLLKAACHSVRGACSADEASL